jgi:adenylosuccinate synthase
LEEDTLPSRLKAMRRSWVPKRLSRLGLWPLGPEDEALLNDDAIIEHWLDDAAAFLNAVTISDAASLRKVEALVFEGAQGLMLDQDRGAFPHVTRSNTGLKNVLALAADIGIAHLNATYVTRCYATRHGAGPLAHELPGPPHPDVIDATNISNAWQGALRFGTLDLSIVQREIASDLSDAGRGTATVSHSLAMTCLDQVGPAASYFDKERLCQASPEKLAVAAARAVGAATLITAYGPTRDAVIFAEATRRRAV